MNTKAVINILLVLFIIIVLFCCSETNPEVKVQNNSEKEINVYFKDQNCISCYSITFLNIKPHSETEYKSCSVKDYFFSVKTDGEEKISNILFKPNHNESYIIIIDNEFRCDIRSFSK